MIHYEKNSLRKRAIAVVLSVLMLLCMLPVSAADGITLTVGNASVADGGTVEMPITVQGSGVNIVQGNVAYDADCLELVDIRLGDMGGILASKSSIDWASMQDTKSGGTLCILVFRLLQKPIKSTAVRIKSAAAFSENGSAVKVHTVGNTVGGSSCIHQPVADAAVAASCTVGGLSAGTHCGLCGEIITAQQPTPPLGHLWKDNVCQRCGKIYSESMASIEIDDVTVGRASEFTVTARIKNNPGIVAAVINPIYDRSVLTLVSAELCSGVGGLFSFVDRIVWLNQETYSADGDFFRLTFRVETHEDCETEIGFSVGKNGILNMDEEEQEFYFIPSKINITACEHSYIDADAVMPTCENAGRTAGKRCIKCGYVKDTSTVPAFGHAWEGGACTRCGKTLDKCPTITVGSATAGVGDTVKLDITVNNNPGIAAASFDIEYDRTVLELVGTETGDFPGLLQCDRMLVWCNLENVTKDGVLAHLTFRVIGDGFIRTSVSVSCGEGSFSNTSEQDVAFVAARGTVSRSCSAGHTAAVFGENIPATCTEAGCTTGVGCIWCGAVITVPEQLPALGHRYVNGYCETCGEKCPYTPGDINADGKIDTRDLVRLMKYISGADVELQGGDVNGDGKIDTRDLVRLMKMISEKKTA